jgi:hypothetical protein
MTNMKLAGSLLTAPRRFFSELAEFPRYALPLWLLLLTTCGLLLWYYAIVDMDWFREQQLSVNPNTAKMSEAERQRAAAFMTRGVLVGGGAGGAVVALMIWRLLEALYYKIVGGLTKHRRTFRQWWAFSWWTTTPLLVGIVPSALLLLFSPTTQIDPSALQSLSLNELFFHRKQGEQGFLLLSNLSVLTVFSLGLTVYGLKCWSGRSWLYSSLVGLAVPVLLIGGVAAFTLSGT